MSQGNNDTKTVTKIAAESPSPDQKTGKLNEGPKTPDYTDDFVELRKRLDKSDRELKALSDAMKSTLVDVRTLVQDMDNPFTLLKDMGVDNLVNKAVEGVENEMNKSKRDEAVKRMTKSPDEYTAPRANVLEFIDSRKNSGYEQKDPNSSRLDVLELIVKELAETLNSALDEFKESNRALNAKNEESYDKKQKSSSEIDQYEQMKEVENNYQAYVQLLSEYLTLRFGRRKAEALLLNEVSKSQVSPRVVRDILDNIALRSPKQDEGEDDLGFSSINSPNADLDDRVMLGALLRSIDKPAAQWSPSTNLFLLMTLVKRVNENKLRRS
jgi:hypothetical protein